MLYVCFYQENKKMLEHWQIYKMFWKEETIVKVSVIMPVHNREIFIGEAIRSILDQTFDDFELLVLDDASTDHTRDVVESFKDSRIRLIALPKKTSLPILRNHGLQEAQGEYIAFMDSDDISERNRFKLEVDFLDTNPEYGVVSGNNTLFGARSHHFIVSKTNMRITNHLLFRSTIPNGAAMIRRILYTELGVKYRLDCFVCEDYAFWVDLIGKTKFENLDEDLLRVRVGHPSITKETTENPVLLKERKKIQDRIHERAFYNLKIPVSDKELILFNRFVGDANDKAYKYDEIIQLEHLFEELKKRMKDNDMVDVKIMEEIMNDRLEKYWGYMK